MRSPTANFADYQFSYSRNMTIFFLMGTTQSLWPSSSLRPFAHHLYHMSTVYPDYAVPSASKLFGDLPSHSQIYTHCNPCLVGSPLSSNVSATLVWGQSLLVSIMHISVMHILLLLSSYRAAFLSIVFHCMLYSIFWYFFSMYSSFPLPEVLGVNPNSAILLPQPYKQQCGKCHKFFTISQLAQHSCFAVYVPKFENTPVQTHELNQESLQKLISLYAVRAEFFFASSFPSINLPIFQSNRILIIE